MDDQQNPQQYQARQQVIVPPDSQQAPQPIPRSQPQIPAGPSWAEIAGQPVNDPSSEGLRSKRLIVASALALVVIGGVIAFSIRGNNDPLAGKIKNGSDTSHLAPLRPASADTPLGKAAAGSGGAEGLAIAVNKALPDPQVTGDSPDTGMKYLEVDLTVKNDSRNSMIVPGTFYYRTASGTLISTATSTGDKSVYANKKVGVAGRDSLDSLSLDPGQSDSAHYLIFQIPAPEVSGSMIAGKLVWYDGYYDTNSAKLAIFDL